MNYNRFQIGGFLGKDPELRYTPGGMAVANFSVAVNRKVKDKPDRVLFMPVTVFDKTADMVNKHFKKGKEIFLEGYLQEEKWDDKETGAKRSKIVMIAERVHFVGKKDEDGAAGGTRPSPKHDMGEMPPQDDDVPF